MERICKTLCVMMVVVIATLGLATVAIAQGPDGTGKDMLPPRPDLKAKLQEASLARRGFQLDAALGEEEAESSYQQYLSAKLGAGEGLMALPSPPITDTRVLVILVDYADLAHDTIPQPNPWNNTDLWVQNFGETHYETMLFSETNRWSLRNYFRDASDYGIAAGADLQGDVIDWQVLPSNAAVYGDDLATGTDNDNGDGKVVDDLVQDAAERLANYARINGGATWSPDGGWANYTSANTPPNTIDYFIIVHAGKGQEAGGGALGDDAVWSTRGSLAAPFLISTTEGGGHNTGYYVQDYVVVSEDSPVGVFVHEMGNLFGLPDTWNPAAFAADIEDGDVPWPGKTGETNQASGEASPAFWDPMAQGCWLGRPLGTRPATLTSWERMQLGWLTPAVWNMQTDNAASFYLAQLSKPSAATKAIKIELPPLDGDDGVQAYGGTYMRGAPPSGATGDSQLLHTFYLDTTATTASLDFWHKYCLDAGENALILIDAGGGYTPVMTYTGCIDWTSESIDLTPYIAAGTINFLFKLPAGAADDSLGWYLDDFELVEDGSVTWSDDCETSDLGPGQGSPTLGTWWDDDGSFPRVTSGHGVNHYYMVEWRNDGSQAPVGGGDAGFDEGLQEAYHMTDISNGQAEYFRYNPGMLVWYRNPNFAWGDNDVLAHPGEGFLLAVDAHADPLLQWTSPYDPWRTRVQMMDATFSWVDPYPYDPRDNQTYDNHLTDDGGAVNDLNVLPKEDTFDDLWSSYPFWDPGAPDNSVKTPQYSLNISVEGENADKSGATIGIYIDVPIDATKTVDKPEAHPGELLEYTIVLTNVGVVDAYNVVVEDTVPSYATYEPGSAQEVGTSYGTITENAGGFVWQGMAPVGVPITIICQARLIEAIDNGTVVENTALVYTGPELKDDPDAGTTIESAPCLVGSSKVADPPEVLAGGLVTYTIALKNTGDMDAYGVMITDCIPSCTEYVPDSLMYTTGWGTFNAALCDRGGITWTGDVPVDVVPTAWITFVVKVDPGQIDCTLIRNTVDINDGTEQCEEFDKTADSVVIQGPNFVESTKEVNKTITEPGDRLDYTITLYNGGNEQADVLLTDVIPEYTTYVPGTLAVSKGTTDWQGAAGDTLVYTVTVGIDETVTLDFSVDIDSPLTNGTMITNTALFTTTSYFDGATAEYYRSVGTEVLSEPRLTNSTKEVASNSVGYGGILTYTITLINDGTIDATNVSMSDPIPAGTQYRPGTLDATPGVGTASDNGGSGPITWTGPISAGQSITVTFEVSITLSGTGIITNTATIDDGWPDHDPFDIHATSHVAGLTVDSPTEDLYCGDAVSVPIRVDNVADLQGFQVTVDFDPSILQVESIDEGTWFDPAAWTIETYDNVVGTSTVAATLLFQPVGLSGSGELYYLNFRCIGAGTSPITITYSLLSNTPSPGFTAIPHNRVDGSVTVLDRQISGRAFMQGRTDHAGLELMYEGTVLATTASDGSYSFCPPVGYGETLELKANKNGYLYALKLLPLTVTSTLSLNDVTLLGGDPIGSQVEVSTPLTCATPVTMTVAGPPDGKVNVLDLTFVGARFGKTSGDADWGPDVCEPTWVAYKADINEDNVVNIFDLVLVGNNFGELAPGLWP